MGGGNEYEEGRTGKDNRKWKGRRPKGKLLKRAFLEVAEDMAELGNEDDFNWENIDSESDNEE